MFKFICFNILFLFTIVIKASNEEGKENNNEYEAKENTVVINADNKKWIVNNDMKFNSVVITCPFCNRNISTSMATSFDCCAFSLCCLSLGIPYIIVQNCRGKGFHISRVKHSCPYCNNVIGYYEPL